MSTQLEIATSPLVRALSNRLIRERWQLRFESWQKPASETEEEKMAAAERRVQSALKSCTILQQNNWRLVRQGSYHNNTNVRLDSDVDLAICLTDIVFTDGPIDDAPTLRELGRPPSPISYDDFKAELAKALRRAYGSTALRVGKKALQLHADDKDRVSVDIVPTFTFELYGPRQPPYGSRGWPARGIALVSNGRRITNFPEQHYANGCDKNRCTGNRFKWVVRILKRLRNNIAADAAADPSWRQIADDTASFLIESLVFNCPDGRFGHEEIYDDVTSVLGFLSVELNRQRMGLDLAYPLPRGTWREVNQIKPLFSPGQDWTEVDAARFVAVAQLYLQR